MSGRACSVCSRPDRPEIDAAIVTAESKRGIARRFAVTPDAIERHAKAHLTAAIVKAQEVEDVANGDALLRQITDLQKRTLAILAGAEKDGDGRSALMAIHQARENVSFLSKLLAELNPAEGQDARRLAEQLARARAEQITISVVGLNQMLDGQISPHEALERLVRDGYLTQDIADEAMRRKREAESPRRALKEAALDAQMVDPRNAY